MEKRFAAQDGAFADVALTEKRYVTPDVEFVLIGNIDVITTSLSENPETGPWIEL